MIYNLQKFPFREMSSEFGAASSLPYLPLALTYINQSLDVIRLLDTGATVNVLPSAIRRKLGTIKNKNSLNRQLSSI